MLVNGDTPLLDLPNDRSPSDDDGPLPEPPRKTEPCVVVGGVGVAGSSRGEEGEEEEGEGTQGSSHATDSISGSQQELF